LLNLSDINHHRKIIIIIIINFIIIAIIIIVVIVVISGSGGGSGSSNSKGNGKGKCIYIALIFVLHARRSGMDHTVLPAITPMPAFTS